MRRKRFDIVRPMREPREADLESHSHMSTKLPLIRFEPRKRRRRL